MAFKKIEIIHSFGHFKVLADSRRLEILHLLMAFPSTLTQLAGMMKQSPAWIRHHILILQEAGFIEESKNPQTSKVTPRIYIQQDLCLFWIIYRHRHFIPNWML